MSLPPVAGSCSRRNYPNRNPNHLHRPISCGASGPGLKAGAIPLEEVQTSMPKDKLVSLLEAQTRVPQDFHPHPKIKKFLQARQQMVSGELPAGLVGS